MKHSNPHLVKEAIELVRTWLRTANAATTVAERRRLDLLSAMIDDPDAIEFSMSFIDNVARPDNPKVAAAAMAELASGDLPSFLSGLDKKLIKSGAWVARWMPNLVVKLAVSRMRSIVGDLVVDADPRQLERFLKRKSLSRFRKNINQLGEAVLGEQEAARRLNQVTDLMAQPDIDYVSVKLSAVASKLNYWDYQGSLSRVCERLAELFRASLASAPKTFLNLDMEEYKDLDLTVDAFTQVLDSEEFRGVYAGIVLQAYLPDSYEILRRLVRWANERHRSGGGEIKIRIVKGANLSMEKVDAEIHGWPQAPYHTKAEVDANYKRLCDWVLNSDRLMGVNVGLASHNLFDIAWTRLLSMERGVENSVEFEMLHGMAPAHSRVVAKDSATGMLLYTPIVESNDFDVAIGYLFRRLEENSAVGNFMSVLSNLEPNSDAFDDEARKFRDAVVARWGVTSQPTRKGQQPTEVSRCSGMEVFVNEPDTDPTIPDNRGWADEIFAAAQLPSGDDFAWIEDLNAVDAEVARARRAQGEWIQLPLEQRGKLIRSIGDELAKRRGALIAQAMREAKKTFAQADSEVSEAIDFAHYYGLSVEVLDRRLEEKPHLSFEPFGVVGVVPPWNFPLAIPAGGVLAALAAGNSVVLKPAPQTPGCAHLVAEAVWAAGISFDLLRFCPMQDGESSKKLVCEVDAVVLTGAWETAQMFLDWKPEMRLFAETSGKNAIVVTPSCDSDLAVSDVVTSAFGHGGQKCSAASLLISVDGAASTDRFVAQLIDATNSLIVGPASAVDTDMAGCMQAVEGKLKRALTTLDEGERWLVEPILLDEADNLWRPGIKAGVKHDSWFVQSECFGPVLGIVDVDTLEEAIAVQNSGRFGLTGGIHTLSQREIHHWLDSVEVGNAYVNRTITGAIVARQPFGGWKQSAVGPGAKAGGPNYVSQLGVWKDRTDHDDSFLEAASVSDEEAWSSVFGVGRDRTMLESEINLLRYRSSDIVAIVDPSGSHRIEVARLSNAAMRMGTETLELSDLPVDDVVQKLNSRTGKLGRVIVLGFDSNDCELTPLRRYCNSAGVYVDTDHVTVEGEFELLRFAREQSLSITNHRFGNSAGRVNIDRLGAVEGSPI